MNVYRCSKTVEEWLFLLQKQLPFKNWLVFQSNFPIKKRPVEQVGASNTASYCFPVAVIIFTHVYMILCTHILLTTNFNRVNAKDSTISSIYIWGKNFSHSAYMKKKKIGDMSMTRRPKSMKVVNSFYSSFLTYFHIFLTDCVVFINPQHSSLSRRQNRKK